MQTKKMSKRLSQFLASNHENDSAESSTDCKTEQIFAEFCVSAPNLQRRRSTKKGIDPDVMMKELSKNDASDFEFEILCGKKSDAMKNFVSKDEFDAVLSNLRRSREIRKNRK